MEPIIKKNPRRRKNDEIQPKVSDELRQLAIKHELKQLAIKHETEPQTEPIPRIYIMGGAVVFAIAGLCYFKLWSQPPPQPKPLPPQPKPLPPQPKPPQKTSKFYPITINGQN